MVMISFPRQQRTKLHSTNPIERPNKELKGRADVGAPGSLIVFTSDKLA